MTFYATWLLTWLAPLAAETTPEAWITEMLKEPLWWLVPIAIVGGVVYIVFVRLKKKD